VNLTDDPGLIYQLRVGYRAGDMWAPHLSPKEALLSVAEHFVDCIENGRTPETGGAMGGRVVALLEAATRSVKLRGHPVDIKG
jgi:predicted dehydrogenase